jgi:hypothetical protein
MRPVDPPGNLYQKVWQLARKSGPAATGREIILWNLQVGGGAPTASQEGPEPVIKFGAELLVAAPAKSMLK